jgi:MFS superfamily sulfate permease-like transporter
MNKLTGMLQINIANLSPVAARLTGAAIGEAHFNQIKDRIQQAPDEDRQSVILDFGGIESASASYLKRLLNPFFAGSDDPDGFAQNTIPLATHVTDADLMEDLEAFFEGKGCVLAVVNCDGQVPRFKKFIGRLERTASETLQELRKLSQATAAQLYEQYPDHTTNQTAWNNRLVQLVNMRVARRNRVGRFWIYQPTVPV